MESQRVPSAAPHRGVASKALFAAFNKVSYHNSECVACALVRECVSESADVHCNTSSPYWVAVCMEDYEREEREVLSDCDDKGNDELARHQRASTFLVEHCPSFGECASAGRIATAVFYALRSVFPKLLSSREVLYAPLYVFLFLRVEEHVASYVSCEGGIGHSAHSKRELPWWRHWTTEVVIRRTLSAHADLLAAYVDRYKESNARYGQHRRDGMEDIFSQAFLSFPLFNSSTELIITESPPRRTTTANNAADGASMDRAKVSAEVLGWMCIAGILSEERIARDIVEPIFSLRERSNGSSVATAEQEQGVEILICILRVLLLHYEYNLWRLQQQDGDDDDAPRRCWKCCCPLGQYTAATRRCPLADVIRNSTSTTIPSLAIRSVFSPSPAPSSSIMVCTTTYSSDGTGSDYADSEDYVADNNNINNTGSGNPRAQEPEDRNKAQEETIHWHSYLDRGFPDALQPTASSSLAPVMAVRRAARENTLVSQMMKCLAKLRGARGTDMADDGRRVVSFRMSVLVDVVLERWSRLTQLSFEDAC